MRRIFLCLNCPKREVLTLGSLRGEWLAVNVAVNRFSLNSSQKPVL